MTTDSSDSCNVVVFDKCDFYAILGILAVYFDTIRQLSHGTFTLSFILSHFVVVVVIVVGVIQADCTDVAVLFIEDKAKKGATGSGTFNAFNGHIQFSIKIMNKYI